MNNCILLEIMFVDILGVLLTMVNYPACSEEFGDERALDCFAVFIRLNKNKYFFHVRLVGRN